MLYTIGAILLIAIGLLHSYLGERYILIRLFRHGNLPKLFGGIGFTKNTLRFAWHLTSVAWFGFAAILFHMGQGVLHVQFVSNVIATTFILHAVISLIGAKGKHFSWYIFLTIGLLTLSASNF